MTHVHVPLFLFMNSTERPSYVCWWRVRMCDVSYSYCDLMRWYVICGMTHAYVWHDSFTCVTWLMFVLWSHLFDTFQYLSHMCDDSCIYVTWLIHMCDMTRTRSFACATGANLHVQRVPFACATGAICVGVSVSVCLCVCLCLSCWAIEHGTFVCLLWFIFTCDMPHSYVWHDAISPSVEGSVCCSVLQCVCCSVLPCVFYSVLQCVALPLN